MIREQAIYAFCGAAGAAALAISAKVWILPRFRVGKSELERRRRAFVGARGRIRDAMVTEVKDGMLFYTYMVSGIEYNASQDVSSLQEYLPADAVGPVSIKYWPPNPANSIVVCEDWSGLRGRHIGPTLAGDADQPGHRTALSS